MFQCFRRSARGVCEMVTSNSLSYLFIALTHTLIRFLEKIGHEGLNNLLAAYPDKTAYAQCIFSFSVGPNHDPVTFIGKTHGKIVPAKGINSL